MTEEHRVPVAVLRDVFCHDDARAILLRLAAERVPLRYSDLRAELDFHPQRFERALQRLRDYGLIGYRAGRPTGEGVAKTWPVYLQVNGLGRAFAGYWRTIAKDYARLAERFHIPDSLTAFA